MFESVTCLAHSLIGEEEKPHCEGANLKFDLTSKPMITSDLLHKTLTTGRLYKGSSI